MRSMPIGLFLVILLAVLAFAGCGQTGAGTQGIGLRSVECLQDITVAQFQCLPGSQLQIVAHVPVWGNELSNYYLNGIDQTLGTVAYFGNNGDSPASTGKSGLLVINNALAPAYWTTYWLLPYYCGDETNQSQGIIFQGLVDYDGVSWYEYESENALIPNYYPAKQGYELICFSSGTLLPASTRFAISGEFPGTITLGSSVQLTTQYGMPILYVYDGSGNLVANVTATSVSSNGTEATFPFPSSLTQSGYSLAIVNQVGGSLGYIPAGENLLSIASQQTIPGNPFGVSVGAQTYTLIDENSCTRSKTTSTNYMTFPVVSLYSSNEVYIGGSTIGVGANPTAVATYPAPPVSSNSTSGCDSIKQMYSGNTRAIVANSGSNTVSILDIVNNGFIANITVGNHPTALAVSSDGSYAYVANYADRTISRVDLRNSLKFV